MARKQEQYVLDIVSKVDAALNPLEKVASLLQLISKAEFINLKIQSLTDIEAFTKNLQIIARQTIATKSGQNAVTAAIKATIQAYDEYHTKGQMIGGQLNLALRKPLQAINDVKAALNSLGSVTGVDPAQFRAFFDIQRAAEGLDTSFLRAQEAIKQFGHQSTEGNKAVNEFQKRFSELQAAMATGSQQIVQGIGRISKEYSDLLKLTLKDPGGSSFEKLYDTLPLLKREIKSTVTELETLAKRGFSQEGDVKRAQELKEKLSELGVVARSVQEKLAQPQVQNTLKEHIDAGIVSQEVLNNRMARVNELLQQGNDLFGARDKHAKETVDKFKELLGIQTQTTGATKEGTNKYLETLQALKQAKGELQAIEQLGKQAQARIDKGIYSDNDVKILEKVNEKIVEGRQRVSELEQEFVKLDNDMKTIPIKAAQLAEELRRAARASKDLGQFGERFKNLTGQNLSGNLPKDLELLAKTQKDAEKATKQTADALERQFEVNRRGEASFNRLASGLKDFDFFMTLAVEKIIRYRIAFLALQKVAQAARATLDFPRNLEAGLAQLAKVTDKTIKDLGDAKAAAIDFATTYGVSIQEVIDTFTTFAQQGFTLADSIKLTNTVLLGAKAASLDVATAVEFLTSAVKVYNVTAGETLTLFDKLLNVQRNFAVSTTDLADSVKVLGTTAEEFGVGIDSLFGFVTAIGETTRKSGKAVADALKTIFARIAQDDVVEGLRALGVSVFDVQGNIRDLDDVIGDLAAKWDTLTSSQQLNIAKLVGGIRRYNDFIVLIDQYNTKLQATIDSQKASGFTARAAAIELETLNSQIAKITAGLQAFADQAGNSLLGPFKIVSALADAFDGIAKTSGSGFGKVLAGIAGGTVSLTVAMGSAIIATTGFKLGIQKLASIAGKTLPPLTVMSGRIQDLKGNITELNKTTSQEGALGNFNLSQRELRKFEALRAVLGKNQQILLSNSHSMAKFGNELDETGDKAQMFGNKMKIIDATSGKAIGTFGMLSAGLKTFRQNLVGVINGIGKLNIAITALTIALPFIVSKIREAKKGVEEFVISLEDQRKKLQDLRKSYEDLAKVTATNIAIFHNLVDTFDTLRPEDQAAAIVQLIDLLDRLKATDVRLDVFDNQDLQSSNGRRKVATALLETAAQVQRDLIATTEQLSQSDKENIAFQERKAKALREFIKLNTEVSYSQENLDKLLQGNKNLEAVKQLNSLYEKRRRIQLALKRIEDDRAPSQGGQGLIKSLSEQFDQLTVSIENAGTGISDKESSITGFTNTIREALIGAREEFDKLKTSDPDLLKEILGGDEEAVKNLARVTTDQLLEEFDRAFASVKPGQTFTDIVQSGDFPGLKNFTGFITTLSTESQEATKRIREMKLEAIDLTKETNGILKLTDREFKVLSDNITSVIGDALFGFQNLNKEISRTIDKLTTTGQEFNLIDVETSKLDEVLDAFDEIERKIFKEIQATKLQEEVGKRLNDGRLSQLREGLIPLTEKYAIAQSEAFLAEQAMIAEREAGNATLAETNRLQQEFEAKTAAAEHATLSLQKALGNLGINLTEADLNNAVLEASGKLAKHLDGKVDKEAIVAGFLKAQREETQDQLYTLTKQLEIFQDITAATRSQVEGQQNLLRAQRAILQSSTQQLEAQRQITKTNLSSLSAAIQSLEYGNEGVAKTVEIQNARLDAQFRKYDLIRGKLEQVTTSQEEAIRLTDEFFNGTTDLATIVEFVRKNYKGSTKQAEFAAKSLEDQLALSEQIANATIKQLEGQKALNEAISFINKGADQYLKKQETIRGAIIDISEALGNAPDAYKQQVTLASDTLSLEKQKYTVIRQGLESLKGNNAQLDEQVDGLLKSINALSKSADLQNDLFGAGLQSSIERARKELDKARDAAEGISGALAGGLNVNDDIVDRYSEISEKQREIKRTEEEIRLLQQQQTGLSEESENYKSIAESIKSAQENLSNLKLDLTDIKTETNIVRNAFTDLGKEVSNIILDIQTDQLKEALTKALTGTTIGLTITDAITNGSAAGARIYMETIKGQLEAMAERNKTAIIDGGQLFISAMKVAFLGITENLKQTLEPLTGAAQGTTAVTNKVFTNPGLVRSTPLTKEEIAGLNGIGLTIDETTGQVKGLKIPLNKIEEYTQETNVILNGVKAAISLLSTSIITNSIAAGGGNPLGASIGSTIGGSIGQKLVQDFGKGIGGLLGTAILPGVGTVLGGLIGGLFGGNQKQSRPVDRPIILPDLEDNTKELKENTNALRSLSVEFEDLRSELINAPARFIAPAQPGLGLATSPGFSASGSSGGGAGSATGGASGALLGQGGLSVSFTINGSMDRQMVDEVVKRIEEVYSKQERTQGNNRRLF